jgi:quercetin dioxygenase-like cupin family protein
MANTRVFRTSDAARFDAAKRSKVSLFESERMLVGLDCFEPGQSHALHAHPGSDKVYVVVSGEGRFTLGRETTAVRAGDVAIAPAGEPHALENAGSGRLVVAVVMAPPPHGK